MRYATDLAAPILALLCVQGIQAQAGRPRFEVASVRPCDGNGSSNPGRRGQQKGGGPDWDPVELRLPCQSVKSLIQWAYGSYGNGRFNELSSIPVEGGPAWVDSKRYEIAAKPERPETRETMNGPMLQALLEDRFKLRIHHQTRGVAVYTLTVARGGTRLQAYREGSCIKWSQGEPLPIVSGQPLPLVCAMERGGPGGFDAYGETLARLCEYFSVTALDRPVIDKTGITGMFNIHLDLTPADLGVQRAPADAAETAEPSDPFVAIQTALRKIGLKLDQGRGPKEFLVIDGVERPSAN